MPIDLQEIPEAVRPYAASAADYVWNALKVELDFHQASLSILEHYLAKARETEGPVRDLVAAAVGCFFGELLRRRFGGSWEYPTELPAGWEVHLPRGVVVRPVGMVAEALAMDEVEGYDGSIYVPDEHLSTLKRVFEEMGPVEPERYYSLTNRFEVLQKLLDVLASRTGPAAGD